MTALLIAIVVIGTIVGVIYLVIQKYRPNENPQPEEKTQIVDQKKAVVGVKPPVPDIQK